jgi:hypothetical protein
MPGRAIGYKAFMMMIKLFLFALMSTVVLSVNKCNDSSQQESTEQPEQNEQVEQPTEKPSGGKPANISTLQELYCEIEACQYNGATVYKAGLNAPDAGSVIYNGEGIKIGSCNYGWGKPDSMCDKLQSCEDVYRVAENIWGKPAIDKYNLGNN